MEQGKVLRQGPRRGGGRGETPLNKGLSLQRPGFKTIGGEILDVSPTDSGC